MVHPIRTSSKQIPGLTDKQAAEIRAGLVWLESAPDFLADDEDASDAFFNWVEATTTNLEDCFGPMASTDDGFLWQDENGDEFEHLCC